MLITLISLPAHSRRRRSVRVGGKWRYSRDALALSGGVSLMNIGRCIVWGIGGATIGLAVGLLLWVPSCVLSVTSFPLVPHLHNSASDADKEQVGENFANTVVWLCVLGGAAVGFGRCLFDETEKERAEEERSRQTREMERQTREMESQALIKYTTSSLDLFERIPRDLMMAERLLDQAERDFAEGAFSPFWSSVEKATAMLAACDDCVRLIVQNSEMYARLTQQYRGIPPRFPIQVESVRGMAAARTTSDRLSAVVRKAQSNFQFATIYEQRKTNQLLAAGFTTLAQALDGMGQRIASSISELSETIDAHLRGVEGQLQAATDGINDLHDTTKAWATQSRDRHDRALQMLDNIQRHRQPTGFYAGIGTKPAP